MANGTDYLMQALQGKKEEALRLRGDLPPIPSALARISSGDTADTKARLSAIAEAIGRGETAHLENMLIEQAELLNYLFSQSAVSAVHNSDSDQKAKLLSMALRAQNASRKTIVTLHEMKHPKRSTTFIKNQQNNLIAGEQANGGAEVDGRAKSLTGTKNPAVEAVAVEHRTKERAGKSRK